MNLHKLRESVKQKKNPVYKGIYNTYKSISRVNVKIPDGISGMLYHERSIRRNLWTWFKNKFYCEPLMRSRCTSVGKNLRTDGDLPLIIGSGSIIIGDNFKVGNRCAFLVSSNLYEKPELIIGDDSVVNYMSGISVEQRVEIGNNCVIAGETMIFDNNSHSIYYTNNRKMGKEDVAPIKIEDHVWIGMRSMILKGVTIGKGSVVASCSVVTSDVPPMTLVGGNPARIIKKIELP